MTTSAQVGPPVPPDDSSRLYRLLEILHDALDGVTSLEAEYRDWSRPTRTLSLLIEAGAKEQGTEQPRVRWQGAGPFPRPVETRRRIWLVKPDRLRVEVAENGHVARLAVRDGARWWRWDQGAGADSGDVSPRDGGQVLPRLLDPPLLTPVRLLGGVRLDHLGTGHRAGRAVLTARGRPRRPSSAGPQLQYELEFDAEHGTMLRLAAYDNRRCVQITEAIGVRYGQELNPVLFTWPPPDIARDPAAPSGERGTGFWQDTPSLKSVEYGFGGLTRTTVWLTGLPSAGKTTLARALASELSNHAGRTCILDGDELRMTLSSDLGLSRADRAEQARRTAHVAAIVSGTGAIAIVALVSPYAEDRRHARAIHEQAGVRFIEIWVDTPVEVCQARDPKGLYADARAGRLSGLTGYDAPYEPPNAADFQVSGCDQPPEAAAMKIARLVCRLE